MVCKAGLPRSLNLSESIGCEDHSFEYVHSCSNRKQYENGNRSNQCSNYARQWKQSLAICSECTRSYGSGPAHAYSGCRHSYLCHPLVSVSEFFRALMLVLFPLFHLDHTFKHGADSSNTQLTVLKLRCTRYRPSNVDQPANAESKENQNYRKKGGY